MKVVEAELGSIVRIKSADDDQSYMLVETKNVDPLTYRISVESPLGKALLHKRKDDFVKVSGPRSKQTYVVDDIIPSAFVKQMEGGWL